jgi:transposase InsO family protein
MMFRQPVYWQTSVVRSCNLLSLAFFRSYPPNGALHLNRAIDVHGKSAAVRVDKGPEFTSKNLELCAKEKGINIQYIEPGNPCGMATLNGLIECTGKQSWTLTCSLTFTK